MTVFEILLIGLGLSMDAAAVSMTNAMAYRNVDIKKFITMPLVFGVFQALMPLFGFFVGGIFSKFICQYSNIVIFFILGFIGAKMVRDGFLHREDEKSIEKSLTYGVLFVQAIATSIDAFAVGVGFAMGKIDIYGAVSIIGISTFLVGLLAVYTGRKFGDLLGSKAEIMGGFMLIVIAIKAIVSV